MALQDLVNQSKYVARKVALGIALSFSLAGAPGMAYGGLELLSSPALSPTQLTTMFKPIDLIPRLPLPQPLPYNLALDGTAVKLPSQYSISPTDEPSDSLFSEKREDILKQSSPNYRDIETNHFLSLDILKKHYHDFEQINISIHYKAQFFPGYYVHYPQAHRIYYVERKDKKNGEGRTTVVYFITTENGGLLFKANEQCEMVRVQSGERTGVEQKEKRYIPPQPDIDDKDKFVELFGCIARNKLYSATGMGSLAVIGPVGVALYISRRRHRSRSK